MSEPADTDVSFTGEQTKMPEGAEVVPLVLSPGDVIYFGGLLIHGSGPNRTRPFSPSVHLPL